MTMFLLTESFLNTCITKIHIVSSILNIRIHIDITGEMGLGNALS